jgi:uncharacterized protein YxjI
LRSNEPAAQRPRAGGHALSDAREGAPLRDRYVVELADGTELTAKGNIVDHEYEIDRDGEKVAVVSKRWFRVRDTYGIDVSAGENDALVLAATVCIDEMSHRR